MTSSFKEQFTGLYATPDLVGRVEILKDFDRILSDSSTTPRVVFLHGVGGIGKTRLLKKALDIARRLDTSRVADDVMDFYHIGLHTPIGLTQAIFEILTPPFDCFQAYQSTYQALNRARLSGNVVDIDKLRDDAIDKFDQDLKQLSVAKRVVLALDTAERVVYGLPGWSNEIPLADSWSWLIKHLPTWQNVVIFMAGREESRPAVERIKAQKSVLVEEMEVESFSLDESLEYFEKVVQILEEKKEYQLAERLKNLPMDFKKGAYIYSEGRPIMLSLLVDYLSFPGESNVPLILHQAPPLHVTTEDKQRYEEALFNRLQQGELGETLIALGRVPKGADAELLSKLITRIDKDNTPQPISREDAEKRLMDVQLLSVVKIRPENQSIFLHDEMYSLLQRHVYNYPYDIGMQRTSFNAIKDYYNSRRDRILLQLNKLYAPVEEYGKESLEMKRLGEVYTQYQSVLTEIMYYFLRHDLGRGFRNYYRYSHEAIHSRDLLMDLQLQAELLSFLGTHDQPIITDTVSVEFILSGLRIRPVMRSISAQGYTTSIESTQKLLAEIKSEWKNKYPSLLAFLYTLISSIYISNGKYDDAEKNIKMSFLLLPSQDVGMRFNDSDYPDTLLWHRKVVRAWTHRVYGYLKRIQGFLNDSVDEYQKATLLLREVDLRAETAIVFNDMGFAQAERGEWYDGKANVQNALDLRSELGHRIPKALSLNTLATIAVHEGQYSVARENAERALSIFRVFSDKRYTGMALNTLAEAIRRDAGSSPTLPVEERIELLRRARDYAREANGHFSDMKDTSRQIESLIELGCACRDWVWWHNSRPQPSDNILRIISESDDALRQAAILSKQTGLTYRFVDALVNLAWLQFYLLNSTENKLISVNHPIIKSISDAEQALPTDDEITKQPQVWAQKGKLFVLKGHVAYYQLEQQRLVEPKGISSEIEFFLYSIAENYSRALDYSSRFALDYQGIRRAKDGIFNHLKHLNATEMFIVCSGIRHIYPDKSAIQTFLINRGLWQMD